MLETLRTSNQLRGESYVSSEVEDRCELEGPQPKESKDDAEARKDFWSVQGDFICCHHNEPRVQLYVPKEETFPIPLKYIDVTRATETNLDVMQEKRIDDYWNVAANRSLSDSWKGFTKFTFFERETSKRIHVVRVEIDKKNQATTRLENLWPEVWTNNGKAAQRKEKQDGQTRSQNSTMLEDRVAFISMIRKMVNLEKH